MMFRKALKRSREVREGLTAFAQQPRQIFLGVIKNNVRREAPNTLGRVGVDQLPNAASQHGANNDVRVENDHLSGMNPFRDAVV